MEDFITDYWWAVVIYSAWVVPITGWALWRAARLNQKAWFVILLLVNTVGILELVYLFYVTKDEKDAPEA